MSNKPELTELIEKIKFATGLKQDEIAKRLGYSRSYLSQALTSGGNEKIVSAVKKEFHTELGNLTENITPNLIAVPAGDIPQQAWVNLTESVLRLSKGVETGQNNISTILGLMSGDPNSNDSSGNYSEDEISEWLQGLGKDLAGQKVQTQGQFVAHAMKKLAEIRGLALKDNRASAPKPIPRTGRE